MAFFTKSFCLPSSVLDESPGKLFTELRRGVQSLRSAQAIPDGSELLDIGFSRNEDNLHITLYFNYAEMQC